MKTSKKQMVSADELKSLSTFIKERSAESRVKAEGYINPYSEGLMTGYADAYELCAKWIDKKIQEANKQ